MKLGLMVFELLLGVGLELTLVTLTNAGSKPTPSSSSKTIRPSFIRHLPDSIVKSAISTQIVRINLTVIYKKYITPFGIIVTSESLQHTKE